MLRAAADGAGAPCTPAEKPHRALVPGVAGPDGEADCAWTPCSRGLHERRKMAVPVGRGASVQTDLLRPACLHAPTASWGLTTCCSAFVRTKATKRRNPFFKHASKGSSYRTQTTLPPHVLDVARCRPPLSARLPPHSTVREGGSCEYHACLCAQVTR